MISRIGADTTSTCYRHHAGASGTDRRCCVDKHPHVVAAGACAATGSGDGDIAIE